jgi:fumarate reductase flavoprotein subunit
VRRRSFVAGVAGAAAAGALAPLARTATSQDYDYIIVGAGTAGLPAALFASRRGARVLLLDAAGDIGGTLHLSTGQMSAAGTRLQARLGIVDTPQAHYDDIIRISHNTVDPVLTRIAVDEAATTFDWLMDRGFKPLPEHPVLGKGHEPYSQKRYYWGADGGRSILAVLRREFETERREGRIDLQLQTPVTALITDDAGAVRGVRVKSADRERTYRGRHILLTCGGYGSNAEMFERLSGYRAYAATGYPYSQGAGIELAVGVGGYVRGRQNYLSNFGSILTDDAIPGRFLARFVVIPQERLPWEIFVNARGERFIREDQQSVDAREQTLLAQPDLRYWIVFDEEMLASAPPGVGGWSREQMREAFGIHKWFQKADDLPTLARNSGIDVDGLVRTVADYNRGVAKRNDALGREHMPRPIIKAPFYAIRHQGHSTTSTVGLAVDGQLRVIRSDGTPIPNLYAAGELLGAGQTQGRSFVGGMMVTPALSFGRILGERLPLGVRA